MNICMVVMDVDFPPDVRIEKQIRTLKQHGYKIIIVCPLIRAGSLEDEWEGVQIHRIAPLPKSLSKLNALFFLITHINILWAKKLSHLIDTYQIDVLHIHDLLPLATALFLKKKNPHVKIISDLHENYPFLLERNWLEANSSLNSSSWGKVIHKINDLITGRIKLWNNIFYSNKKWRQHERHCLTKSDRVIVVVDEEKERVLDLGVPKQRVIVIRNTVELDQKVPAHSVAQWQNIFKETFLISYIGSINLIRELDVAIKALPNVLSVIPNAHLCIVGDHTAMPDLLTLVTDLNLSNSVTFTGWQPPDSLFTFVDLSDVGLLPLERNEQTDRSSPNKLFWYMLRQKPIVASDCRSVKRVILETGCGMIYEAGNQNSLAQAITLLGKDSDLRTKMGLKGRQAVLKNYNWSVDAKRLVELYKGLS